MAGDDISSSRSSLRSAAGLLGALRRPGLSGRVLLLCGVILAAVAISASIGIHGWETGWSLFGVEWPHRLPILDSAIVTAAAESHAAGHDPLHENPRDVLQRSLNYPRIWHALAYLGVTTEHTSLLAAIFIALFLIAIVIAFEKLDLTTAALLLLFLISPAVLFGVERGNSDLLVFFLMALALRVGRRDDRAGSWTIFLAAILKIYPGFALGYCLRMPKGRLLRVGGLLVLVLVVYAAVSVGDLRAMRAVTETSSKLSYGVDTAVLWIQEQTGSPAGGLRGWLTVGALIVFALAFLVSASRPVRGQDSPYLDSFRIGAGVFLGTSLLMSNWDYRLVFLFFVVPQLVAWTSSTDREGDIRLASVMSLVLVMLVVWRTGTNPGIHLKLVGLLFCFLSYLYARSLPGWVLRPRAKGQVALSQRD